MDPRRFSQLSHDEKRFLQDVFNRAWMVLQLQFPERNPPRDARLQKRLGEAIVAHALSGVSDAGELFKLALKSLRQERAASRRRARLLKKLSL